MNMISFLLYLMMIVCFYAGGYHVFYVLRKKGANRVNLVFSALCLVHGFYFIAQANWYSAGSITEAFLSVRFAYSFISLALLLQIWFFYYYTEKSFPKWITSFGTVFFGTFSLLSFIPGELTFAVDRLQLKRINLFDFFKLDVFEFIPGSLFELFFVIALFEMIFLYLVIVRYNQKQSLSIFRPMPVTLFLLLVAAVYDVFVVNNIIHTVYLSEFAYMLLVLVMDFKLTDNFINAMNEIEELNTSLDLIVKKRTEELDEKNRELEMLSYTDQLTNIFNRRYIENFLIRKFEEFERYHTPLSVILLDVDYFKLINDNYGHDVGDMVLTNIACILSKNARKTDVVGRWGGEEFLIVCPQTDIDTCKIFAERLRSMIERKNHDLHKSITASFGIAQLSSDDTISTIIKKVDMALYEAKNIGRNCIVVA